MIKSTFTGNPYQPKAAIKGIELYKPADAVNGRILDPSVARTVIANAATRRFLDRGTIPIGDRYIHGGVVGAGIHFDQPGALIAAILHQMRSNDYEKQWLKNAKKYLLDRFPGFNPTVSEATDKREASWTLNRTKPKKLIEKQIGLKIGEGIYDANYIELIRFSPPKDRWIDDLKADERRMVGFFMHIKRNPVTILSAIRLTPFPSIYGFSEAFDLYFQLAASRSKKTFQESRVRSHVPSLITEPTSLSRYYVDFSAPNRKGNTFLLTDANAWTESSKPYAERERARVRVNRAAFAANAPINDDDQNAYQSIKPIYRNSSIEDFYNVRTTINDDPIGFCAPSNQAVVKNRSYTPFPIFAMYIRMLDQYGVTLKGELATRLGEIKYDRPETLAQYQDAMVNILNSK